MLQRRTDGKDIRVVCDHCRDRLCEVCARGRGMLAQANIERFLRGREARMITFTLRHNRLPLTKQLDRLHQCFLDLRRRKSWKTHVNGGVAIVEVKHTGGLCPWHVHAHVLCEGKYWAQRDVSEEWYAVTGDSTIVDIRQVKAGDRAARYVTKYVTKPADDSVWRSQETIDEFAIAMKGRRVLTTFGTWRKGIDLNAPLDPDAVWENVAKLSTLLREAGEGNAESLAWLDQLDARDENWWNADPGGVPESDTS